MRLAVLYPDNQYSAWSVSEGLCDTLARMGHEVTRCGFRGDSIRRSQFPKHEELNTFDALVVSGPEHTGKYLHALYPDWKQVKTPKLGWLHESVRREDYGRLDVEAIKRTCDINFCPAESDTDFGFTYLPFGVDTEMFHPVDGQERDIPLAFMGLVYEKRKRFLAELAPHLNGETLRCGNCLVQDMDGVNVRKSAGLYAANLRRIKVFLNLPSLSRLVVTKWYEVQACGAYLVECNGKTAKEVGEYLKLLNDRTKITEAAALNCSLVHKHDRLELRLEKLLASVSVAA